MIFCGIFSQPQNKIPIVNLIKASKGSRKKIQHTVFNHSILLSLFLRSALLVQFIFIIKKVFQHMYINTTLSSPDN